MSVFPPASMTRMSPGTIADLSNADAGCHRMPDDLVHAGTFGAVAETDVFVATFSNQSADAAACRARRPHPADGRNLLRIYHVVAAPLVDERSRSDRRDVRIREVEAVVTIRLRWSVVGVLAAISLASTDLVLILQAYFGYRPALVLLGPPAAATGATVYAVWLSNRV